MAAYGFLWQILVSPPHETIESQKEESEEIIQIVNQKRKLNALTPVECLPNELLAHIFVFAMQPRRYYEKLRFPYWLSHVCSRWRELVIGMPVLWSTIRMHTAVSGVRYAELEHAFERSSGASLHISLSSDPEYRHAHITRSEDTTVSIESEDPVNPRNIRHSTLELLARRSDKVRSLYLSLQYPDYVDALRLIPLNGPQLLSLTVRISDRRSPHHKEPDIPDISTSHLQHLSLDGFCIPWTTSPFPKSLVTLRIDGCYIFNLSKGPSWQELFDALQGLCQLTELELGWRVMPEEDGHDSNLPYIESIVSFPQLDVVRLEGYVLACAYLLEHLVTPPSTRLSLTIHDEEVDPAVIPRLLASFTSITNIERELGPFILDVSVTRITVWHIDKVVLSLLDRFDAPRDEHFGIWMAEIDNSGDNIHTERMFGMCSYPWVQGAREINISDKDTSSNETFWRPVLRATSHLQSIRCDEMQFRTLPSLLGVPDPVPPCDKFLVPSLSKLRIPLSTIMRSEDEERSPAERQIEDWCEMFRARRIAGCMDIRLELRDTRRRPRLDSEVQADNLQLARLREVTEIVIV
ncbi:hypothetical protein EIP91_001883 [Steccherinum ochraceum]|uniref:Uncharacterized protein n=1 Tax=Steccherinum ochraceum TaxID=92696 RepID=A0A4R0RD46_9APHY|nr:hypothetical protein EIP91_001883 [Steccherinum ochraceum]